MKKILFWIRYGKITSQTMATTECGLVAEESFRGRGGKRVGYWAYGSFDPSYPYQGQNVFWEKTIGRI